MHGQRPTLKDIFLELDQPDAVDLHCNEQLASSEEEDNREDGEQPTQPTEPAQQAYRVVTSCCRCCCTVRLVVESGHAEIRQLQELLLGALHIVCPLCA
ncbi:putative transforming protein E7 [Human papillomavirus type 90]|uniref:Protein E7 n=2 Tax=Human papillomavirus type 90 TaxID=333769 RepID=Q8JNA0_9PAPI|nr:putative transforming protein E7 [Human papillomavirus type 90]WBM83446.1 E7 protein [Alphapapillomavirus 14]AAL14205.1 putative transforming protein E7 [Human papillomavirus type 90]ALT55099.1 E7 [Human papillomavirus type 90]WAB53570.1 E7 [Human papillomavirus type 90]WAB53919.1 E7 [Human papillomavirus type 90]